MLSIDWLTFFFESKTNIFFLGTITSLAVISPDFRTPLMYSFSCVSIIFSCSPTSKIVFISSSVNVGLMFLLESPNTKSDNFINGIVIGDNIPMTISIGFAMINANLSLFTVA